MDKQSPPARIRFLQTVALAAVGFAAAVYGYAPYANVPRPLQPAVQAALEFRVFTFDNWPWLLAAAVPLVLVLALAYRAFVVWWHNTVVARLSGADVAQRASTGFPKHRYDLTKELARTPEGKYFVGRDPGHRPVYLSELDLDTHLWIMGQTGSGKTKSVLEPLMLQDLRHGKGLAFIDAKASSENIDMLRSLAAVAGRVQDLRVFALAHPTLSHTYNPVHLGDDGDPDAAAERVFSVFPLEHEYYKGQAWLFFRSLMRLMAATGKRFCLNDIRVAVVDDEIRAEVCAHSSDRRAVVEINSQLRQLGKKANETFTGLYNALTDYEHPLLNAYNPDIIVEDVMNNRGVVYFSLPANRYPILAPSVGKILLQHIQAVGALRQIDRKRYDQTPFSVTIDELNRFAFPNLVPALCMLRDARVQFRLSHQSYGDLEQVSDVFATQVKDNTRCHIFLFENDAENLERISKAYGTKTTYKKTVAYARGPLLTLLNTGKVSNREVEEFILHPNALKNLAPCGQGYVLLPNSVRPVNLEILPRMNVSAAMVGRKESVDGLHLLDLFVAKGGAAAGGN